MLEKDIEARVCEYARAKGVLAYKFTSPARAAVPERVTSCNKLVITNALRGEMARLASSMRAGGLSTKILPLWSVTRVIMCG